MAFDPTSLTPPESDPDQTDPDGTIPLAPESGERRFPCAACGARLTFAPGTTSLTCAHCGAANEIEGNRALVPERDFRAYLGKLADHADTVDQIVSHCEKCGANVEMPQNVTAHACPFCGSEVVATGLSEKLIKPGGVVPFKLPRGEARAAYQQWIKQRWFAPSDLKTKSRLEHRLSGIYLPFWTYDSQTVTDYTGQRGEHYYVTVPYTTTVNGKVVTRTRRERRTRWYPARGRVLNEFDDLLVAATTSLPDDLLEDAGPWDLKAVRPYADEFLAGFRSESYAIGLPDGFARAEVMMQPTIDQTIRRDIGGDEQRISSKNMTHRDITFKHLLLPVWVCAYRYKDRAFQVIVNAQTGEVVGDRPYSAWKIALATTAVMVAVGAFVLMVMAFKGG